MPHPILLSGGPIAIKIMAGEQIPCPEPVQTIEYQTRQNGFVHPAEFGKWIEYFFEPISG
jgi:hypothetical protein